MRCIRQRYGTCVNQNLMWNNRFKYAVGYAHPTIWKAIDKMRQEISVNIEKIELN